MRELVDFMNKMWTLVKFISQKNDFKAADGDRTPIPLMTYETLFVCDVHFIRHHHQHPDCRIGRTYVEPTP